MVIGRECLPEHGGATFGLFSRSFVLDDVPVLNKNPVFDAENIHNYPIGWRAKARKAAVQDDKVALRNDEARFMPERRREAFNEVEKSLPARGDVGAVLDVIRRPEPLGRSIVSFIEESVEGLEGQRLISGFLRLAHVLSFRIDG